MSKKNQQALLPKLRFPEFQDTKEWERKPLSDVLTEHGNKSSGSEEVFSVSVHKGLINQIEHLGRSYSSSSTTHYKRVLPGDIVYTKSPTGNFPLGIIKQSKIDKSVLVSPLYGVFTPVTKALGSMLNAYFESPTNAKVFLEPLAQKGAKNTININNDRFLSGTMFLPVTEDEQQRIADCLSSIDELITAESYKLDALKDHNKGLMQQLFPVEVEMVPKLRFPEFQYAEEWEEKKLLDISELITKGTTPEKFTDKGVRFIKIEAFCDTHIIPEKCKFIDKMTHENELRRSILKENDILFAIAGATIGKVNIVTKNLLPANTNQALSIIRLNKKENVNYILSILKSEIMKKYIRKSISVGAQPNLNLEQIGNFKFSCPKSAEEQQRIADCLTSLDELITAQAQKLEALKMHKKGLVQGLFPLLEGVVA